MRVLRSLIAFAGLFCVGASLMGCRTTEGFGEDMERGGQKIQREAREHR